MRGRLVAEVFLPDGRVVPLGGVDADQTDGRMRAVDGYPQRIAVDDILDGGGFRRERSVRGGRQEENERGEKQALRAVTEAPRHGGGATSALPA